MYDTHVHSTFSPDGSSTIEEYAALMECGIVKGIGFAEHVDFMPECGAYGYLDYNEYVSQISLFRRKGYNFFAGAEIDFACSVKKDIDRHLAAREYDYTICSVHMIDGMSVSNNRDIISIKDLSRLCGILEKYYAEVISSIKSDVFDIIGHIGVYKRYIADRLRSDKKLSAWIESMDSETAKICAHSGSLIEVNTSGLHSPLACTVPDFRFLETYYRLGGRNISIGSDAHNCRNLAGGFKQTFEMLKEIGFNYLFNPWNKHEGIKI